MRRMVLAAAALLALVSTAGAQLSMPGRTITLVVTVAAGGGTDVMARIIAEQLQERLKQPVVVENRVGGGGTLGVSSVARAAPDGQTLLFLATSAAISKWLYKNVPFDVVADFAYVARAVTMPVLLVAHPSVPANTLGELIALAKAKPGSLTMASGGIGSSNHLVGELFQSVTGTKLLHIPYKGAGAVAGDLMGGQVQLLFDQLAASTPNIKSGKLKAFAVTSATRASVLPEVPTMVESGLKEMDVINITGLLAPIGTSPEIVARLNAALLKVLARTEVKERFATLGVSPLGSTPEQFATFIRDDYAKWTKVITDANIKAE